MLESKFLIIGAGQTGLVLAKELASLNYKTILVDQAEIGGSHLYSLDFPKQILHKEAQEFATGLKHFKDNPETFSVLRKARQKIQQKIQYCIQKESESIWQELKSFKNLEILTGKASFVSKSLLEVNSETERHMIKFENCLLAVGKSNLLRPNIKGIENVPFLFQHNVFLFEEIPTRLAIIGFCRQNVEVAHIYSRLGVKVDIYEEKRAEDVLPEIDASLVNFLLKNLINKQVDIKFDTKILEVTKNNKEIALISRQNKQFTCSHLYIQVTESFAQDNLNLSKIGITSTKRGIITTLDNRTTNHKNIFAFGNCNTNNKEETKLNTLYEYIDKTKSTKENTNTNPLVLFGVNNFNFENNNSFGLNFNFFKINTSEPVITIGYTEKEVLERFGKTSKTEVLTHDQHSGFAKFIFRESGQILGISMAGDICKLLESYMVVAFKKSFNYKEIKSYLKVYWEF